MLPPPPHPTPLAPLRASPCPGAHLHHRLPFPCSPPPLPHLYRAPRRRWSPPLLAHASGEPVRGSGAIDALLSAAELLCLAPPAICSVVCAARLVFTPGSAGPPLAGGKLFVVQYVLLLGAVAIGMLIRRRQWGRLRRADGAVDKVGVGLAEKVEKMEESVRSVMAAVRVLSRTVEKLGVRFRVLRRTLRDPIDETATLAQKNSEATQILAAQENLLGKEIGVIQKVLYAMQEQQQKQLELIFAIGEASKILDDEQDMLDDTARSSSKAPAQETKNKEVQINTEAATAGNNKP